MGRLRRVFDKIRWIVRINIALLLLVFTSQCDKQGKDLLELEEGSRIVLIGNNLASRMGEFGYFETELHLRYPDKSLFIRNMAHPGHTPAFRMHSSRNSPWAFPGAEKFSPQFAAEPSTEGHFPTEDEWLTDLKADIIIAFFGYNESFEGKEGVENFKKELDAFIKHTHRQQYNGATPAQLALVSPIAFQDFSDKYDLPDGKVENTNIRLYTDAMKEVAAENKVLFLDVFSPTKKWFDSAENLTIDGSQLSGQGYKKFAELLADRIFGKAKRKVHTEYHGEVRKAVLEKNWMWLKDFKIPNGVHAYGRRYNPFGPDNYPAEQAKLQELTAIRDTAIWKAAQGIKMDLELADRNTSPLPEVETNYDDPENEGYLYGQDALHKFHMAPGYKIELFASEKEFPDLANPVQISFDNEGRLWVATMPTYPHWKPGDPKPNDKIIILEDTDGDGKADKQTTFAEGLHLPIGFEIAPEGVYVSQSTHLILLKDTNGDGKADSREILLSGFDDHDTHHAHGAYTADPSGAIYMGEGVFLHSNVETSYGTVRATNGGFFRYNTRQRKLERIAQVDVLNPWGIAFDDWGQPFYTETSSPDVRWMMPGMVKPKYGKATPKSRDLLQLEHRVRPTSGLEFISSRHFPDTVQGDFLINNTIGFLGTKQHSLVDDGTGYKSKHRLDLLWSEDKNFRPVDMEFAPDGSLYLVDWHNVLVGHMQHNARDPLRDHMHGRIYRVTYPSRPLVKPAKIAGASIRELFENLKLPEYRSRYRTRRELRGREPSKVLAYLKKWVGQLHKEDAQYEHHLLEALWVSWGLNQIDQTLLEKLLEAKDHRVRAAAVQVLRNGGHQIPNQTELLVKSAGDQQGRVRLEAIVAASWLEKEEGLKVLKEAKEYALDEWMKPAFETSWAYLKGEPLKKQEEDKISTELKGEERELYIKGSALFAQEGFCATCHQSNGRGLESSGFPPLAGTRWVLGNEERLIKLTLKGLYGPIKVLGKEYPGQVPMTSFGGLLNDEEVAAVLTYVRNSFGNNAAAVTPEKVKEVREKIQDKEGFYRPEDLLREYPLENK